MSEQPVPTEISLHTQSKSLGLTYGDVNYRLSAEYLRVHSPSAEVRGHGVGQEVLQTGKENVGIKAIEPVGHYAIKLIFDDGHDSGLFTWEYLYKLATQQEFIWQSYLNRLKKAGYQRQH
ncbi:MAG TPA: DUF971 domain-containing protein [Methylophaga aminisulfidivorans]|uniref:DUF971 domain-containing protein n=2 Tax=root TaxID=1 RepID=A0A7C1ZR98_9GAMM|nr:DUF971 domain-containing protein [Methylophaga aminisulfidivorans]